VTLKQKSYILPIIILSQFGCTSLWFAGNAVIDELVLKTGLGPEIMGYVLSSVQLGFILGTFVFALFMIADRFPPSKVFLICSLLAAGCNSILLYDSPSKWLVLLARSGTGFFLAGIYPVGMKIAADYFEKGLGKALGYLVGALVLGTSFPHLLKGMELGEDYTSVVITTSIMAVTGGGVLYFLVPDGPYRKASTVLMLRSGFRLFRLGSFRKAAMGYFGHMWELYAFWAFIPLALKTFNQAHYANIPISLWTFAIIGLGGVSCAIGGHLAISRGSKNVALTSLILSGGLCLASPLFFILPTSVFLLLFCLWGVFVASDSPQFSTLVANSVPVQLKGTALTLVNCIGFSISIISIQLLTYALNFLDPILIFTLLSIGPILGTVVFFGNNNNK